MSFLKRVAEGTAIIIFCMALFLYQVKCICEISVHISCVIALYFLHHSKIHPHLCTMADQLCSQGNSISVLSSFHVFVNFRTIV